LPIHYASNWPTGVLLILTKRDINKLNMGSSHNIHFSVNTLEGMRNNWGLVQALLPFLLAILFGILAITGMEKDIKVMTTNKKGDGMISDLTLILPTYFLHVVYQLGSLTTSLNFVFISCKAILFCDN